MLSGKPRNEGNVRMQVNDLIKELKDYDDLGMDVILKTMRTKTIPQYHLECEIYVQYGNVVIATVKGGVR